MEARDKERRSDGFEGWGGIYRSNSRAGGAQSDGYKELEKESFVYLFAFGVKLGKCKVKWKI